MPPKGGERVKHTQFQVHRYEYNQETMELTVTQSNGTVIYSNVRISEYNALKSAIDKTDFILSEIRPSHRCNNA